MEKRVGGSEKMKGVEERKRRIKEKEKGWRYKVAVLSGKGGVGKSTLSVNLAAALASRGYRVGLLDADIHGPDIAKMMGIVDPKVSAEKVGDHTELIPPEVDFGGRTVPIKVLSLGLFVDEDEPIIWRGPVIMKALWQFLGDVKWGELDFFIIDFPPGTGDEILTVANSLSLDTAIVVTTPQEVSILDCGKAVSLMKKLGVPSIAVVENMSYLICPYCGGKIRIFGEGGGRKLAEREGVEFLGEIPFDPKVREAGDEGVPIVLRGGSEVAKSFMKLADWLEERMSAKKASLVRTGGVED